MVVLYGLVNCLAYVSRVGCNVEGLNIRPLIAPVNRLIQTGEVWLYGWPPVWLVWIRSNKYSCCLFSKQAKQLSPNKQNRRSAVQWYFPLRSKWVFSDIPRFQLCLGPRPWLLNVLLKRLFVVHLLFFFKYGPFPASFSLFSSFQYTVDSKQMFNI